MVKPFSQLQVTFWGTRASYPFFLPSHQQLGGDTSCVGLRAEGHQLFVDGGTGLMHATPTDGHDIILLTHFHLDHVLGLPYFLGKKKKGQLTLASAACEDTADLQRKINSIYGGAGFPVPLSLISPAMQWLHVPPQGLVIDGWDIRTCPLNHPGTASGYRVRREGSHTSAVYLTDHEHGSDKDDPLRAFAQGASLIVWDSSYDDRNFQNYRGWGHSTWQEGLRFGQSARVRRVALSHHDPSRDDAAAALIRETLDPALAFLAHDRMQVTLDTPDMDSAA